MNFGRAFSYITEDPEWLKKVGIAALVMLIPIIGQMVVMGWALELTRRVINHEREILPDWNNFSDHLSKGFPGFVIYFVYILPVSLLSGCMQSFTPMIAAAGDNSSGDTAAAIVSILSIASICVGCLVFVGSIVITFILPAALANYAATGQIGAGFRFGEIFGLVRAAPGPYFMVFLGSIIASILASLGLIACIIGVLFTSAYAVAVNAHWWGQAYNAAKAAQGGNTPIASAL